MNVLVHVHMRAPEHGAGAERFLEALVKHLTRQGHKVKWHIPLIPSARLRDPRAGYEWADVAITHLDETPFAVRLAQASETPLVHLVHNGAQLSHWALNPDRAALIVYNSHSLAALAPTWARDRMIVVHPPVRPSDYRTPGDGLRVTLVNLSLEKGGGTFWRLARRMPEQSFLGVRGAYGAQLTKPLGPAMPNVTIWPQQREMTRVYAETRLLLMPSAYESYGRCAVEAACSGIPVVCTDTPGLREATMGMAEYVRPGATAMIWREAITRLLDNPARWQEASDKIRVVANAQRPDDDCARFEAALQTLIGAKVPSTR